MDDLTRVLQRHGIDATPSLFADTGHEKIHSCAVNGADAVATWHRLRGLVEETGCWPVLLGGEGIEEQAELVEERESPSSEIIEAGVSLDPVEWLAERERGYAEDLGMDVPELYEEVTGEWPEGDHSSHHFSIPFSDLVKTPFPEVYVALVPTKVCWEVPAVLNTGGWNECPVPEVHVCLMKRWHELYGAEVVGISRDIIEMYVARPPRDKEAALALAKEQYLYCPDIVDQGTGTLENLAAALLGGTSWYFWWD
jgi:hypothetical protein